jgi:hypothetical protein
MRERQFLAYFDLQLAPFAEQIVILRLTLLSVKSFYPDWRRKLL